MNLRNTNDTTDAKALGPDGGMKVIKTTAEYNEPGLPAPPAGWGNKLGFTPANAPDTCC